MRSGKPEYLSLKGWSRALTRRVAGFLVVLLVERPAGSPASDRGSSIDLSFVVKAGLVQGNT